MQVHHADVVSISPLNEFVTQVILAPKEPVSFKAGQYCQLVLTDSDKRAFSIANKPSEDDTIELHIGASGADSYAMQALDFIKRHFTEDKPVTLEVGLGISYFQADRGERPLVLLAGGTGFSYIKSIADHLAEINYTAPVLLYWGVREARFLYAKEELENWASSKKNFQFIPVVQNAEDDWQGHSGLVHQAVMKDIVSLEPYDIYMAGRFDMIGIVRDDFIEHGAHRENMFADAFAFIK